MCTVCGCGPGEISIDAGKPAGANGRAHGHSHEPAHSHHHDHAHAHDHGPAEGPRDLDFGAGPARAHAPGLTQSKMIEIETNILAKNDGYAAGVRLRLAKTATLALNLVSSPGSGKTTLLCETLRRLSGRWPVAVIEGDQQTANDAERIRETGAPAVQVNTGKGCHLDAHMVGHALDHLTLEKGGVLFIENVGNLVCPAAFDLGEAAKVAVLSITEGEDKPLKYPDMFAAADLVLLNKIDLAPHLDFDVAAAEANARRVNPAIETLRVSARSGEGLEAWLDWIAVRRRRALQSALESAASEMAALETLAAL